MPIITLDEAVAHLNMEDAAASDILELTLFVDAAEEWVTAKVTDTTAATVRLATLMLVGHWWETQRGPASNPLNTNEFAPIGGPGYAIPNRVKELLGLFPATNTNATGSFPDAVAWPDAVEWPVP